MRVALSLFGFKSSNAQTYIRRALIVYFFSILSRERSVEQTVASRVHLRAGMDAPTSLIRLPTLL